MAKKRGCHAIPNKTRCEGIVSIVQAEHEEIVLATRIIQEAAIARIRERAEKAEAELAAHKSHDRCNAGLRSLLKTAEAENKVLREALISAMNRMGGPTMTYSPENEVNEWRERWEKTAIEFIAALTRTK